MLNVITPQLLKLGDVSKDGLKSFLASRGMASRLARGVPATVIAFPQALDQAVREAETGAVPRITGCRNLTELARAMAAKV